MTAAPVLQVLKRRPWSLPLVTLAGWSSGKSPAIPSILKGPTVISICAIDSKALQGALWRYGSFALAFALWPLPLSFALLLPAVRSFTEHIAQQFTAVGNGFLLVQHLRKRLIQTDVHFSILPGLQQLIEDPGSSS